MCTGIGRSERSYSETCLNQTSTYYIETKNTTTELASR